MLIIAGSLRNQVSSLDPDQVLVPQPKVSKLTPRFKGTVVTAVRPNHVITRYTAHTLKQSVDVRE